MGNSLEPRYVDVGADPILLTENRVRSNLELKNVGDYDIALGKDDQMEDGFPLAAGEFQNRAGSSNPVWAMIPNAVGAETSRVWIWETQ